MRLDTEFMAETFIDVLSGIPVTLELTFGTLLISSLLGLLLAICGAERGRIARRVIAVYVSFVRGTPVVLQILFLYSLLPTLLNYLIKTVLALDYNIFDVNPILYAFIVFTINTTALLSEVFRSALVTVSHGQMEAALSIGMNRFQAYIRIILPQAFVTALPNICNVTVNLLKSTSLAFMMTVKDVTAIAKVDASFGYNYLEAYLVIFAVYILLCSAVQLLFTAVEKREAAYRKLISG